MQDMKKIFIYMIFLAAVLYGCDDYLDVTPKGLLLPESTQDFSEMMGDPAIPSKAYPIVDLMGDNCFMEEDQLASSFMTSTGKAYLWQDEFFTKTEDDQIWNDAYSVIYTCNLVLERTDGSTGGSEADKKRVKAEARFNRAYYYWWLHSCYAKAYDPSTAAEDLSVPLRLTSDLEVKLSRATSDKIVAQLLEDIKDPEDLPEQASSSYRINRGGAYALCARVYLYLGDYENALKYAELALEQNSNILDFNSYSFKDPTRPYSGINNRPTNLRESPEVLMYRGTGFSSLISMCSVSEDLIASYDTLVDLRYKFNYTRLQRNGSPREQKTPAFLQELDYNIGVPEMLLIKAECLARKGDRECLKVLDQLRIKRIEQSAYRPLDVPDDKLLQTVLDERQRELVYSGLRFFDMKRLSKEGVYTKTVTRTFKGETFSLAPNSNQYLVPISSKLMTLNSNILPNPR